MSESLSFFTPVSYGAWNKSRTEALLEWVDDCFFFGGHKGVLLSPSLNLNPQQVEIRSIPATKVALKIAAWAACFIAALWNPLVWCAPVALLSLKVILRATHTFYFETNPLQISRAIKIPPRTDFRELRNDAATSDLILIPYSENGMAKDRIHAHSHLTTDYFKTHARSPMHGGLDEKESKQTVDLSKQLFATAQNIHLLLDYHYGLGIQTKLTPNDLLSLFALADYVLAHDLKKEILALLLLFPESRENLAFAPLFRNMLLTPQLTDEEFERLFEWYMECAFLTLCNAIHNDQVQNLASKGNVRAQLVCSIFLNNKSAQYASELAKKKHPLAQFVLYMHLSNHVQPSERIRALQFLQASAESRCASAIGALSYRYYSGTLGLPRDHKRAFELAEQAVAQNSLCGIVPLGLLCTSETPQVRDPAKAFEHFHKAAQFGQRYAEYYLGNCFELGIGTSINKQKALEFYMKAKRSFEMRDDKTYDKELPEALQRVVS